MLALTLSSLAVALISLGVAASALRRTRRPAPGDVDALPLDVAGLRSEVAALQAEQSATLRHLAVVRYDAFADAGGHLSWSVALLDDAGDGVLITSINGRSEARTYAKVVAGWTCEQQLSPEETNAIESARP